MQLIPQGGDERSNTVMMRALGSQRILIPVRSPGCFD